MPWCYDLHFPFGQLHYLGPIEQTTLTWMTSLSSMSLIALLVDWVIAWKPWLRSFESYRFHCKLCDPLQLLLSFSSIFSMMIGCCNVLFYVHLFSASPWMLIYMYIFLRPCMSS